MKKNTYPVAGNAQAEAYREIFNTPSDQPGRIKGINNSPNLIKLFPESPLYTTGFKPYDNDRGNLLPEGIEANSKLTSANIASMFAKVVDGVTINDKPQPHVLKQGGDDIGYTSKNNYNWLYRDQPIDMNFNYLKASDPSGSDFTRSSPDSRTAPVGSNAPIENDNLNDKPFWGHANLQVPSVDPFDDRDAHVDANGIRTAQLKRGTGGFGTSYPISNRAFASQEKIGKYFTETYINPRSEVDSDDTKAIDRMTYIAGKSIVADNNTPTDLNPDYEGDIVTPSSSISTTGETKK